VTERARSSVAYTSPKLSITMTTQVLCGHKSLYTDRYIFDTLKVEDTSSVLRNFSCGCASNDSPRLMFATQRRLLSGGMEENLQGLDCSDMLENSQPRSANCSTSSASAADFVHI
jgi:hypothetical protein